MVSCMTACPFRRCNLQAPLGSGLTPVAVFCRPSRHRIRDAARARMLFCALAGVSRALRLASPPAYYLSSLAGLSNSAGKARRTLQLPRRCGAISFTRKRESRCAAQAQSRCGAQPQSRSSYPRPSSPCGLRRGKQRTISQISSAVASRRKTALQAVDKFYRHASKAELSLW